MTLEIRVQRARRLLASIEKNYSPAALASSFGAEDMVLLDLIAHDGLAIEVFTIDTGRLPEQTHELIEQVRDRYGMRIEVYSPWPDSVAAYIEQHGIDGFYEGVPQRQACCNVRKVEPLRRALERKRGWITGLRREQADSRTNLEESAQDPAFKLWKFNPLVEWTEDDVWTYLHANDVPYNALHMQGYPSIGCDPCTRAIRRGEHPRAGRWWWEQQGTRKECGLHGIPIRVLEEEAA
jgi:phosphoadenosine phosphosulfate reductase